MGNMETFTHEVVTWTNRINNHKKINWKFTSNHANRKLFDYSSSNKQWVFSS